MKIRIYIYADSLFCYRALVYRKFLIPGLCYQYTYTHNTYNIKNVKHFIKIKISVFVCHFYKVENEN